MGIWDKYMLYELSPMTVTILDILFHKVLIILIFVEGGGHL